MPLSDYDPIFKSAAQEWNLDPNLLKAIAAQESGGNPKAVSKAHAQGLMQIIPETQKYLGITDPNDPVQSIYGAAKYLSEGLDKEGTPEGALLFYHGGPDWRNAYGPESKAYVPAVTAHYKQFSAAQPATLTPAAHSDMSDADFLKSTGGGSSAPAAEDDASFLARTGGKAAAPDAPTPDAGLNEYGIPTSPNEGPNAGVAPPAAAGPALEVATPVANVASEAVAGAKQGFGTGPLGLSEQSQAALERAGIYNGPGEYNPLKAINRAVINPLAAAGGLVVRGGGALLGAYQHGIAQAGEEIGQPALGRDLAALPEAFPTGDTTGGTRLAAPSAAPPSAAPATPRLISEAFAPAPVPGQSTLDRMTQLIAHDNAEVAGVRNEVQPNALTAAPSTETPLVAAAKAEPKSVGAAASRDLTAPENMPQETPEQKLTNLGKSVTQSAEDRAGPQSADHTVYVPGVERPLAAREFSAQNSLDDKTLRATDPAYRAEQEKIEKDNNQTMVDLLGKDAGDDNALKVAHDDRSEVAPPAQQLFANERPVDATGVVKHIDDILAGPDGKRSAVVRTLSAVKQSLFDADGKLETLPSQLYGARKNITDLLKKGVGDGADDVRASKSILTGLLDRIDPIINDGAPKYQTYLDQFHEASQPINQMEFLQKYQTGSKKLTNVDGYLQLSKVQKMLDDIYQGRKASGINAAKSLTEEQIQNITNVRNELAAMSLKDRLAKVKGSDTMQQTNRSGILGDGPLGAAVKGAAEMGAHALLFHTTGGIGNAAMAIHRSVIKPAREASKAAKQENALVARKAQLLETKPRNPLASP